VGQHATRAHIKLLSDMEHIDEYARKKAQLIEARVQMNANYLRAADVQRLVT
jgi:hypothetical protein